MSNLQSGRPAVLGSGRKLDRVALLEKVAELGSISAAAKAAGVSYKGAWQAIEALNNLSDTPVVERLVGGSGGAVRGSPHTAGRCSSCCAISKATFRAFLPRWVRAASASTASTNIFKSCGDGT